jgi:hypothetical protein
MRKILLTSVGIAALAVSANATDFTLSGTAKVKVADDGNTSVDVSTAIGVSKTFDNGMVLSLSNNNMGNAAELTIKSDAISVTFGDIDQNEKAPGLGGDSAGSDIASDGVTTADSTGAISLGATIAGVGIGAAMNDAGDTLFGGSFTTDLSGVPITIGGDVYSDNDSENDQIAMGVKATLGSLAVVAHSVQKEAVAGVDKDVMSYSAAYTTGGLVIGFQGNDADASSYSATYTIVPGMQFELGSKDDGSNSTSSAELQMSF